MLLIAFAFWSDWVGIVRNAIDVCIKLTNAAFASEVSYAGFCSLWKCSAGVLLALVQTGFMHSDC